MNGRRLATVEQVARVKDSDKKVAAGGLPEEGALWREYGGEEIAHHRVDADVSKMKIG